MRLASSDLIVRVKMADVQKFVADGRSVQSTTDGIGDAAGRAGRTGSAGFGLMSKSLTILRRTAYLAGGSMTALSALVIKNGLSYNAAFQSATTSFTTLLGSSDKARKLMDDLREVSNGTPLRFTEVLEASKRMLGMGVSAERTVAVLKGLNAAILATGGGAEQFDRASLALGQMQAKGKVSAEELMQLAEAGVPVNKILQRELGLTAQEVSEIGKSGIDSGKVLDAIARGWQRQFGNAARNARNDWNNQTAQLTKDWEQFQRIVTEPLFVRLNTDFLPRAMRTVRAATKGFQQGFEQGGMMAGLDLMFRRMDIAAGAGGRLIKAWRRLVDVGRDLGKIVSEGIVPGLAIVFGWFSGLPTPVNVLTSALGFLAGNTDLVKWAVVALLAVWIPYRTATLALAAAHKLHAKWVKISELATTRWKKVVGGVRKLALNAALGANLFARRLAGLAKATKAAMAATLLFSKALLLSPVTWIVLGIAALAVGFYLLYTRSEKFRAAVQWLWDKLKEAFFWVKDNWPLLLGILTGPFGLAVLAIVKNWDKIKAAGEAVWNWISGTWSSVTGFLTRAFTNAWGPISGFFGTVKKALGNMVEWFKELPGKILAAVAGLGASLAAEVVNPLRPVLNFLGLGGNARVDISPAIRDVGAQASGAGQRVGGWTGVNVARGGSLIVGERGRELVTLPAGAQVHRHSATENALAGGNVIVLHNHLHVDGREMAANTVRHVMAAQARA